MTLFHILAGEPEECICSGDSCGIAGENDHFTSAEAAQNARVKSMVSTDALDASREIVNRILTHPKSKDRFSGEQLTPESLSKTEDSTLRLLDAILREQENKLVHASSLSPEDEKDILTMVSGLHFSKEMLSPRELVALSIMEEIVKSWYL